MKRFFLIIMWLVMVNMAGAQNNDVTFFMKGSESTITQAKCSEMGELWVRVPIPSNIAEYDNFTVFVYLSTIDYNLRAAFDKNAIEKNLAGQQSIDLFLLGPEGTPNTDFGDQTVYNDLCNTPRNEGVENFEITVNTKAFKILRYESVTYWDEYRNAYITRDNPIWDDGDHFSSTKFTIIQSSLNEGVQDTRKNISFKIPRISSSTFNNYEPGYGDQFDSQATIIDQSTGQDIKLKIMVLNTNSFTLEKLSEDFGKWLASGGIGGSVYNPNFHFPQAINEHMNPGWRVKFNDIKEKALSDFAIGDVKGKQFTWYQGAHFDEYGSSISLHPGVYCKLYFFQNGNKTYIVSASMQDQMKEEYESVSWSTAPLMRKDFFKYKITEEHAAELENQAKQLIESIRFSN